MFDKPLLQWKHSSAFVCIAGLHVTVNNVKMLSVAQKCLCGEFLLPATIKHT
jgi:hypothetical protein